MDCNGVIWYAALVEQLDILLEELAFSWEKAVIEVVSLNRLTEEQTNLMISSWNMHHGLI